MTDTLVERLISDIEQAAAHIKTQASRIAEKDEALRACRGKLLGHPTIADVISALNIIDKALSHSSEEADAVHQ